MRIDKLTSKFQMALADAQSLAVGQDHAYIEPVHLMLALLDQEGGSVRPLLAKVGANLNRFRNALDAQLDKLPKVTNHSGDVQVSQDLTRILNLTDKLAQKRQDQFISSELFVLAALDSKGPMAEALRDAGASKQALEKAIEEMRGGQAVNDAGAEDQRQALDKYTIDLTARA